MDIKKIPVDRINPAAYNPRKNLKPDDSEYQHLLRSMNEFGCVEPLVWNRRTGHLVGGHQRYKILLAQGATKVPVSVVNLTLPKEKALNLALNKISGEWDQDKLADLLEDLAQTPDFDIALTGFDLPEIEALLANDADQDDDFDPESALQTEGPPVTCSGDIIELGQHRIMCGDARNVGDVSRLLGNKSADLLLTDPPYNVNYDGRNRPKSSGVQQAATSPSKGWHKIKGDHLTPRQYRRWFKAVVENITDVVAPGGSFYIWNSHKNFGMMHDVVSDAELCPACVITWAKETFAPGFGDFNQQTEFCLYGHKRGKRHCFYGPTNASTLWQVHRDRTQHYRHPTQKPLELFERAILYSSQRGEVIFDPFLGSGTTLIAAARLGRRCFGMEIDPRYCDVIVRRYIALIGEKVVNLKIVKRYRLSKKGSGS